MNILITRPLAQAEKLKSLVKNSSHNPVLFPVLDIKPLNAIIKNTNYDVAIFISKNAVDYGLKTFKALNKNNLQVFAVGPATAKRLADYNIKIEDFPRKNASSAGLLAIDKVKQLKNKKILIFRGKGGVETLKNTLQKQNNIIEYAQVYERIRSDITPMHKKSIKQFLMTDVGVITITSIDSINAMLSIVDKINPKNIQKLKNYPLVVFSHRIKDYANSLGFKKIRITQTPSDNSILQTITPA